MTKSISPNAARSRFVLLQFVWQAVPQSDERLYLVILKSIGSDGFDVGGKNLGHRTYLPIIFNGLRMMQE